MLCGPGQFSLPDELKRAIRSEKCVAFIGSGVSIGCYHSWRELVKELCNRCGVDFPTTSNSDPEAFLDAAQAAKDADEGTYYSYLGEYFGRPAERTTLLCNTLLSLPFASYLTTNFDPLLAVGSRTTGRPCHVQIYAYPSLDRKVMGNKRTIHYLHGYIAEGGPPEPGTIVLSRTEFDDAYAANSNLMNFLVPTLENEPVVFVGCGLKEPPMRQVFDICKQHQKKRKELIKEGRERDRGPPGRFILVPRPEATSASGQHEAQAARRAVQDGELYYKELEITPVWYPAPGGNHSALCYALEEIVGPAPMAPDHGWGGSCYAP